jgi:hypothetical protein
VFRHLLPDDRSGFEPRPKKQNLMKRVCVHTSDYDRKADL